MNTLEDDADNRTAVIALVGADVNDTFAVIGKDGSQMTFTLKSLTDAGSAGGRRLSESAGETYEVCCSDGIGDGSCTDEESGTNDSCAERQNIL